MKHTIQCPSPACGRESKPTAEQRPFIEASAAKGMTFIVLNCPYCTETISYNPQHSRGQMPPKKAAEREALVACPGEACDGYVCHVRWTGHAPFWGCGGCGEQWESRERLDAAITDAVAKHPYRGRCYRKAGKAAGAGWEPVALSDDDRAAYEEQVRREGAGKRA
jgi:hypothetical protein